jgi:hypothetical protein
MGSIDEVSKLMRGLFFGNSTGIEPGQVKRTSIA